MMDQLLSGRFVELATKLFARHEVFEISDGDKQQLREMFGGRFPFREQHFAREIDGAGASGNATLILNEQYTRDASDINDNDVMSALGLVFPGATQEQMGQAKQALAKSLKIAEAVRALPTSTYKTAILPAGVLAQIKYKEAQQADRPNRNRHIYQYDSMVEAVKDADRQAKRGELFHLAGHPGMCETPSARKISGVIRSVGLHEASGRVPIELDVMEGEQGRAIFNLLRIAAAVPISSRAWGDFEIVYYYEGKYGTFGKPIESEEDLEEAEEMMLIKDFFFEGWDFVAGPQGVKNAIVLPSTRGAATMRQEGQQRRSGTKQFNNAKSPGGSKSMDDKNTSSAKLIERLEDDNQKLTRKLQETESVCATKVAEALAETAKVKANALFETETSGRLRKQTDELDTKLSEARTTNETSRQELAQLKVDMTEYKSKASKVEAVQVTCDELNKTIGTLKDNHTKALEAKDVEITGLNNKLNPPPKTEAELALEGEKQKLVDMKAEIAEQKAELERTQHVALMKDTVTTAIKESKYSGYSDITTGLVFNEAQDIVPTSVEEAKKAVESVNNLVGAILSKGRDLNFAAEGAAPGSGAPANGQQPQRSYMENLTPVTPPNAAPPERGAGPGVADAMLGMN